VSSRRKAHAPSSASGSTVRSGVAVGQDRLFADDVPEAPWEPSYDEQGYTDTPARSQNTSRSGTPRKRRVKVFKHKDGRTIRVPLTSPRVPVQTAEAERTC